MKQDTGPLRAGCLDNVRFLERGVGAAFADGLYCAGREGEGDVLAQFRHEYLVLLEVGLTAQLTARVELRSAGSVGIAASYKARFPGDGACLCHNFPTLSRQQENSKQSRLTSLSGKPTMKPYG